MAQMELIDITEKIAAKYFERFNAENANLEDIWKKAISDILSPSQINKLLSKHLDFQIKFRDINVEGINQEEFGEFLINFVYYGRREGDFPNLCYSFTILESIGESVEPAFKIEVNATSETENQVTITIDPFSMDKEFKDKLLLLSVLAIRKFLYERFKSEH